MLYFNETCLKLISVSKYLVLYQLCQGYILWNIKICVSITQIVSISFAAKYFNMCNFKEGWERKD